MWKIDSYEKATDLIQLTKLDGTNAYNSLENDK